MTELLATTSKSPGSGAGEILLIWICGPNWRCSSALIFSLDCAKAFQVNEDDKKMTQPIKDLKIGFM
jgi:hypothetical protein